MKVSPLGDQAKGTALCTHTPPSLTAKQPEQLAAPLEPGEGGKELIREGCWREEEEERERESQTQRELGGSCSTGEPLCCYVL